MDQRTRRSPARFLAPLALIAVVVAAMAIVSGNGNGDKGSAGGADTSSQASPAKASKSKTSAPATGTGTGTTVKSEARKTYTIKVGDTLGGIADKVGVSVEQLQELNPNVDPHAMTAGQKIRLR